MFHDCRLGSKDPDPKRLAQHVHLTPDDVDACLSRVPYDWHKDIEWNDDDLGNRDLNLCGPAAAVNYGNLMAKVAGLNRPVYGRAEAERIYRYMGWDGTWATDDGVVLLDMMIEWMKEPFCGVKLDAVYIIGHGDDEHMATANVIGPTIAAASLTQTCKSTDLWDEKASEGRVWGNHAFLYFADSPGGGPCKTWGRKAVHTPVFRKRRWLECYLPICFELMPNVDFDRVIKIARQL